MKQTILNLTCAIAHALVIALATAGAEPLRVEPPFWWTEMPVSQLQLQLHGDGAGGFNASINYPGVTLTRQERVDSPNYLFLYLDIGNNAQPGQMRIDLRNESVSHSIEYELRQRPDDHPRNQGFNAADVIYLLMPDRFANGDLSNDSVSGLQEKANRQDPTKRQGGDLAGIEQRLDYIENLGVTAVWFTPVLENDMPPAYGAYHGYATTDFYRIDPRFGSNDAYRDLIDQVHRRGMKVIMDMIHNHIGIDHWWMRDLPSKDWIHDLTAFGLTNFRGSIPPDTNASQHDRDRLVKGWFVPEMPDLDQRNPLLADYLIQNTIWWIEYSGIDGIRMDTYLYPYPEYMARWAEEILAAYPNFKIIGEAWVDSVPQEAFWQFDPTHRNDGYDSKLPSVTDFPLCFALREGLAEPFSGKAGLNRIYQTLSQDFLYTDPMRNVIFLDNHDMGRISEALGKDPALFKIAYSMLMTLRGVPQVYYGTELMLGHENRGGDDEAWRQTMPGGWIDDARFVFDSSGRTDIERDALAFVKELTRWRRNAPAIHEGEFLHFVPENNVYVYFRRHSDQTVMVAINLGPEPVDLDTQRFREAIGSRQFGKAAPNGVRIPVAPSLRVDAKSALILELE